MPGIAGEGFTTVMTLPDVSEPFQYTGADNLEVMSDAVNYNDWLAGFVARYCQVDGRTLDYGAGSGTFAEILRERGLAVSCLEPDRTQAVDLAERSFVIFNSSEEINDGEFDTIYSLNVIEHIADDSAAAAELFRILRPGGKVFVYVPAFMLLFGQMDRKVGHHRRYTRSSLSRLFLRAGFEIEQCRYADSMGFFATLVFNLKAGNGSVNRNALIFYDRIIFPLSRLADVALSKLIGKNVWVAMQKPISGNARAGE